MSFGHSLECFAVFFGLINILLCIRTSTWNWFFGILMVTTYTIIFFRVKLYADMAFQLIALFLQFYGWLKWQSQQHEDHDCIGKTSFNQFIILMLVTSGLYSVIALLLQNTDSTTVGLDAFTTAASLVALWMQAKKMLEHWLVWIVVDIVSIYMYAIKNLYLTMGLYSLFLLMCIMGFITWHANYQQQLQNDLQ